MQELRRIREERGWSQYQLARAAGINRAAISRIERGLRTPKVTTLERLAEALGVEVADFFPKVEPELPIDTTGAARVTTWAEGSRGMPARMPREASEYVLATLEAVERGELTAREAYERLVTK